MSLFGNGNRKLTTGDIEVEKKLDEATQAGVDIIELLWYKVRYSVPYILGVDAPNVRMTGKGNFTSAIDYKVNWVKGGALRFFPDFNGRCWGYVADTEHNRDVIARAVASGKATVVDGRIKKEINELIDKRKMDKKIHPMEHVAKREDIVDLVKQQNEELKAKLAEMEARLEESESQKKPLAGVKIKPQKREEAKEQLSAN